MTVISKPIITGQVLGSDDIDIIYGSLIGIVDAKINVLEGDDLIVGSNTSVGGIGIDLSLIQAGIGKD